MARPMFDLPLGVTGSQLVMLQAIGLLQVLAVCRCLGPSGEARHAHLDYGACAASKSFSYVAAEIAPDARLGRPYIHSPALGPTEREESRQSCVSPFVPAGRINTQ
jgi:hypothetical protein